MRTVVQRARSMAGPWIHRMLNLVHPLRGRRRFRADYEHALATGSAIRINIGAGKKPLAGWLNTDLVWQVPAYLDATRPWPVRPGSVDLAYGDDMIEHVTLDQGRRVLRHAYTALAPGGILRLATPDVEAVARQYLENGDLAQAGMDRNRELGKYFTHPVELLREVYVGAKHYLGFIYDYDALSAEMRQAGFEVRRARAGESEHPDLTGLEARMHPAERATGLVVEGIKPPLR